MKQTLIVCSSNRAMQDRTQQAIDALCKAGARLVMQRGSADVAYARNFALSGALQVAATYNKHCAPLMSRAVREPPIDTILMVDDDMEFSLDQANELVEHTRKTGVPASAMYATMMGTLAATRLYTEPGERQRWVVGLGFLAIPLALLKDLAARSEVFEAHGADRIEFTWAAAYDGAWCAEDYTLCRRLGGVHLLPFGVGHLKTVPIYPDPDTIALIRDGKRLPGDTEQKIISRIEDPVMLAALRAKK